MEFNRQESARRAEHEQQRQTQQTQQQRQDARQQSSQALQQQMDQQHRERQQQQQTQQQGRDQRKTDSQKEAALLDQQKKRQAQERNRNELKRQPRDGQAQPQPQPASKNVAVPPGPAAMSPELKPGAALQQSGKDSQVAEASRAGVKQVLSESSHAKGADNVNSKAPEKPVSAADARHLMTVAGQLGIGRSDPSQPSTSQTQAQPLTREDITRATDIAQRAGCKPSVIEQLKKEAEKKAPEIERVKQPEIERDMGR